MLSISLFGSLQASLGDEPVSFSYSKLGALLAILAIKADEPHSRDTLAEMLWPDRPTKDALARLRKALSDLKRAIPSPAGQTPYFLTTRQTIQFNPESVYTLDVTTSTELIRSCETHNHVSRDRCQACLERLSQFADLYRGELLSQFFLPDSPGFDEWVLGLREQWRQTALVVLSDLALYYERRNEPGRARPYAEKQIAIEPWRESAYRQLMRLALLDDNRNRALVYYETCRKLLAEELGVEPESETTELYKRIVANEQFDSIALHQLPIPPTSFVGREEELALIAERLAEPQTRLLTILGPGGIGKSRLAIQAADQQRGLFPHGIFFVPLAPIGADTVNADDLIVKAIAQAVHFDQFATETPLSTQIENYLREKAMLLLLDNCEHLVDDLGFVETILREAPAIKLLATSRESLNLVEEQVLKVKGLPVPAGADQPASQLFIQSARRMNLDFDLTEQDWPHFVQLCQLLNGVPLGLELAASWTRSLSCAQIVQEAERSFAFLATRQRNVPQRHRSMQAVFDYSWRLLEPHEQAVFARLSVFRGDFTAEAAYVVASASLFDLSLLVDKSLVQRNPAGRYQIHTLLRQFAVTRLTSADKLQAHNQHARHYLTLLQNSQEDLQNSNQYESLERLGRETNNIRFAWGWATQQADFELIENALGSLHILYITRGWLHEGYEMMEQAVKLCRAHSLQDSLLYARLRIRQGRLCEYLHPSPANSFELLTEAIDLLSPFDQPAELVIVHHGLGFINLMNGEYDVSRHHYELCLNIAKENALLRGQANAQNGLSQVSKRQGNLEASEKFSRDALTLWRRLDSQRGISSSLVNLGWAQVRLGQHEQAQASFVSAVEMSQKARHQVNIGNSLNGAGAATFYCGDVDGAADYFRRAQQLYADLGDRWGEALAWSNLGFLMMNTGRYEEAKRLYKQSVVTYEQTGVMSGFAHALGNLASVYHLLDEKQEAQHYFVRALEVAVETKGKPDILGVLVVYAPLLAELGQRELAIRMLGMCLLHPAGSQDHKDNALKQFQALDHTPSTIIDESQLDPLVEQVLNLSK